MSILLAALTILFCPLTDTAIQGYHCFAYAVSRAFTSDQDCPIGLCRSGAVGLGETVPHDFAPLDCAVDPNSFTVTFVEEADPATHFVMFGVELEYDPNVAFCTPGACTDVWWNVTLDLAASCECEPGACQSCMVQ